MAQIFFGEEKLTITPANRLFCVYLEKTVLPYYVFPLSKFCDIKYYAIYMVRRDYYTTWYIKNYRAFPFFTRNTGGVAGNFI